VSNGAVCNNAVNALKLEDVSYWRVEGFTFQNVATHAVIRVFNSGFPSNKTTPVVGIEILNNMFIGTGTNGYDGVSSGCFSRQIHFLATGRETSHSGPPVNVVRGNTFTGGNYGNNVDLDRSSDTLIEYNTSTGNKARGIIPTRTSTKRLFLAVGKAI